MNGEQRGTAERRRQEHREHARVGGPATAPGPETRRRLEERGVETGRAPARVRGRNRRTSSRRAPARIAPAPLQPPRRSVADGRAYWHSLRDEPGFAVQEQERDHADERRQHRRQRRDRAEHSAARQLHSARAESASGTPTIAADRTTDGDRDPEAVPERPPFGGRARRRAGRRGASILPARAPLPPRPRSADTTTSHSSSTSNTAAPSAVPRPPSHSPPRRKEVDAAAGPPARHQADPLAGRGHVRRPQHLEHRSTLDRDGEEARGAGEAARDDRSGDRSGAAAANRSASGRRIMTAGPGGGT